jgi:hypothetical protein
MRAVRPRGKEGRLPEIPGATHGLHQASEGTQKVRIVMVNREAFLLTYVWHLTTFFGRVCPVGLPAWECWSYGEITRPSGTIQAGLLALLADPNTGQPGVGPDWSGHP